MLRTGVSEHAEYTETRNLGELFREKLKGQTTHRQKNPNRLKGNYKKGFKISGIRKVAKVTSANYKQGFYYKFTYIDEDTGKQKTMQSTSVRSLHTKMNEQGFDFVIDDIKRARSFLDNECNKEDFVYFFDKYFKK